MFFRVSKTCQTMLYLCGKYLLSLKACVKIISTYWKYILCTQKEVSIIPVECSNNVNPVFI